MTLYDDAIFACSVIFALVGVPFMLLAVPAGLQVLMGDWTTWNGLLDWGLHLVGFFGALCCCLLLIAASVLEAER